MISYRSIYKDLPRIDACKPTNKEIKQVTNLLADFRIFDKPPEFKTKFELYHWRDEQIRMKLNK